MDKKQQYEVPAMKTVVVKMQGVVLQNSIEAKRSSYGSAQTDEWN